MERLSFANSLLVTIVGMLVVFLGLCILIMLIKVLAMATERMGKNKEKPATAAPAPAPVQKPVAEVATEENDDALIVVISAAVACMMEQGSAFTVRRVRRISDAPAWQKAGREEQIYSRF